MAAVPLMFDSLSIGHDMANNKSAIKRWHQSLKARDRNRSRRTAARSAVRKVREAVAAGAPESDVQALLAGAYSALDRAAKGGAIHEGNADRKKSRLAASIARSAQ
jgi:small subunit ribosomal protein S20